MSEITDNHELMQVFYKETQDLIDEMKKDLATLKGEEDFKVLRRLFRCAHTIKSSSGSVGFDDLEKVTQSLERIFQVARDKSLAIGSDVIPLLMESADLCERLLRREEVTCYEELLERLKDVFPA